MAFVYHTNKKEKHKTKLKKNKTNSVRTQPAKDDATRRCTHVESTNRFKPNKKRVENTRTNERTKKKEKKKKKEEWKIWRMKEATTTKCTRIAMRTYYCMPMHGVLVRETDDDCMPLRLIAHASTRPDESAHWWLKWRACCAWQSRCCDDIVYRRISSMNSTNAIDVDRFFNCTVQFFVDSHGCAQCTWDGKKVP